MNDRVNPFAHLKEDAPVFGTKPKPEKPVEPEAVTAIAERNNFTSRQPAKQMKPERRKPRTYRTGRNVQFNCKATPETIARFYRMADEKKVILAELFEMAVDALERDGL